MTNGSDRLSPDPGVGERLREFDAPSDADKELIDRMFDKVKGQCAESDRTLAGFLRSRSTLARRAIVLAVFSILAVVGWFGIPLAAEPMRTTNWASTLIAFCVLLVIAMFIVTRPVHRPSLPGWQAVCLVCVAVGATILTAFWPSHAAQAATHAHSSTVMAGACMGFGLLLGIPVYALLRLVDRGNAFGSLIAAAAAGVAGNFVLKAHCSIDTTGHVLLGHASVALLFVLGLGLVHRWIPSK